VNRELAWPGAGRLAGWLWTTLAILLALGAMSDQMYLAVFLLLVSAGLSAPPLRPGLAGVRIGRKAAIGGAWLTALFGMAAIGIAAGDRQAQAAHDPRRAIVIRETGYYRPILNVDIDLGEGARDADVIERAGEATGRLAKMLTEQNAARPVSKVVATYLGPQSSDAAVGRKVLHLTFDAPTLRKGLAEGLDGVGLMGTADNGGHWTPTNDDIISDYCVAERRAEVFCMRF